MYLINADSQKEKERVKELKTGMRQRKTQRDRWKQEDRDTNTRLGEREMDGQVRCKWGELRKKWIEQGLKTTEKTVWTDSRADQKER